MKNKKKNMEGINEMRKKRLEERKKHLEEMKELQKEFGAVLDDSLLSSMKRMGLHMEEMDYTDSNDNDDILSKKLSIVFDNIETEIKHELSLNLQWKEEEKKENKMKYS
eukprot:785936_1